MQSAVIPLTDAPTASLVSLGLLASLGRTMSYCSGGETRRRSSGPSGSEADNSVCPAAHQPGSTTAGLPGLAVSDLRCSRPHAKGICSPSYIVVFDGPRNVQWMCVSIYFNPKLHGSMVWYSFVAFLHTLTHVACCMLGVVRAKDGWFLLKARTFKG